MLMTRPAILALVALGTMPAAAAAAAAQPLAAAAQATPPGLPGPPPGNGTDLPAPPGTAPAFVAPGTAASVPATTGPGLVNAGDVALNRAKRTFTLAIACQANGTLSVTAKTASPGTLAKARFRCKSNRASVRLQLSKKVAGRVAKKRTVAATAKLGAKRLSFTLSAGGKKPKPTGFWTDGHLQCAPESYLVEPDFTTASTTPISTRGWVAWYTAAGGWHWLGVNGEDKGRWDTWTATRTGIAQFHPEGAIQPVPFTWGPISFPAGQGITAIGVYEIVYWTGGHPQHQWQYVNAGTTGAAAAGGATPYCTFA
jgi:hypothetical protein